MHTGRGQVLELILEDGCQYVRISCPPNLTPGPGQYLLAGDGSDAVLPVPLLYTDSAPEGFVAMAPVTVGWTPGLVLHLRGPLGRGFSLPLAARRVALVAFDDSAARLRGLIRPALRQGAAVVLVGDSSPENLPDDVEVQPPSVLEEILEWSDYAAFDIAREHLQRFKQEVRQRNQQAFGMGAQVLIRTPVPCGGIAECGVCGVTLKSEWQLACKDGPVFDWGDL